MQTKYKVIQGLAGIAVICSTIMPQNIFSKVSAVTCPDGACNTNFQVNVKETISISITEPSTWARGNVDTFLRNKINVEVTTNNASGFVVGMNTASTETALVNTIQDTNTIPTLSSSWTRNSSVTNFWGYSLNDASDNGTYNPMVGSNSSPIKIFDSTQGSSKDVYFGAKADSTKASGTYLGTVVFSVVSDANNFPGTPENPSTPSAPQNPATPNSSEEVAVYNPAPVGGANGTTTYTYRRTNTSAGTTTTTTQVSDGDNRTAYNGYTPPQGVRQSSEITESNIANSSSLATTLATTSALAAAAGLGFFIIAKRREDDDEEEEENF